MPRLSASLVLTLSASLSIGTSPLALAVTNPGTGLSVEGAPGPAVIRAIEQPVVENRPFATGPDEHFELLFNDGTSLTLAPNAALTVERYSFDGETGELAFELEAGLVRVAGGRLNRAAPISINSGSCSLAIEDASAVIAADPDGGVRSYMLVGSSVALTSGGATENLVRPMYQTTAACTGDAPSTASRVDQLQVQADAFALNPSLAVLAGLAVEPAAGEEEAEEEEAEAVVEQEVTTPPAEATPASPPPATGGFGVGDVGEVGDFRTEPTSVSDSGRIILWQDATEGDTLSLDRESLPQERAAGPTANRIFGVSSFSQRLDNNQPLQASPQLLYRFSDRRDLIIGPVEPRFLSFLNGTSDNSAVLNLETALHYIDLGIQDGAFLPTRVFSDIGQSGTGPNSQRYLFDISASRSFFSGFDSRFVETSVDPSSGQINGYFVISRDEDNFLIADVAPGELAPNGVERSDDQRFIFAAGDVDGAYQPSFQVEVEQFFVSAGLDEDESLINLLETLDTQPEPSNETIVKGIRAFLRNETAFGSSEGLGIPLSDSGILLIRHPDASGNDEREVIAQVLHTDFGLPDDGKTSTISLTVGELERFPVEGEPGSRDAELSARTLASSRNDGRTAVFMTSPLRSTAAGGGNPNLPGSGRVGYLVVENYIPEQGLFGGIERPLGAADPLLARSDGSVTDPQEPDFAGRYAVLRLLTGKETIATGERSTVDLTGHAAGLLESYAADTVTVSFAQGRDGETSPPNLGISTDPAANTLAGTLTLSGADEEPFELALFAGGSAFVDDDRFAALAFVDDDRFAALASVDDDRFAELSDIYGDRDGFGLVTAELLGNQPAYQPVLEHLDGEEPFYQHVQWGYFFGDRIVEQAAEAERREHIHLGSWVAGQIDPNEKWNGTGTYKGHVVGNVLSGGELATRVGTFENSWDFGARRGDIEMDFDGRDYTGQTRYRSDGPGFRGNLSGGDRQGSLSGNFYRDTTNAAETRPGAVGGQFNLSGDDYRAAGTFAGDRIDDSTD